VTVCIAAIATGLFRVNDKDEEHPVIIGASDRMITAGDIIEYEPDQSKISRITPFIVALSAGDDAIQAEILNRTENHISKILSDDPYFFAVEEAADVYSRKLIEHKKQVIERTVLQPVGLKWDTYMSKYSEGIPYWFEERMKKVFGDTDLPITETIIAGVDESGAHIFVIDESGYIRRQDRAGFAAVGIGAWHAESQFMFERHSPLKSYSDTLFLTYVAKRRSEVAPGVGRDTDLFAISLNGGYIELLEEQDALKKVYNNLIKKTENDTIKLRNTINNIMIKVQEERKAKYEKIWQDKIRKWEKSGKLEDSPIKAKGTAYFIEPDGTSKKIL